MSPSLPSAGSPAPTGLSRIGARASLFCLALMLALPFQVWTKKPPIPSFHAESIAVLLGLLAMSLGLAGVRAAHLPRAALLPTGFVVLLLLQAACGHAPYAEQALLAALCLAWALGLSVLAATLSRLLGTAAVAAALSAGILAGATLAALAGLVQHHQLQGPFTRFVLVANGERVWGNLAQPNHLADYLTLGLASLCHLFALRRLRAWSAFPLMLLITCVLASTGSRAALLYLTIMAALAVVAACRHRDGASVRLVLLGAAALGVFLLLPMLPGFAAAPGGDGLGRFAATALAQEQRIGLWQAAWQMFLEAPLQGQGFGQFGHRYFLAGSDGLGRHASGLNGNAHNLVLQVAAEFGLPGVVALLVPLAFWVRGMLQRQMDVSTWWMWAAASVLGVHSLLEYPLWYAYFLGAAALLLGLAEPVTQRAARASLSGQLRPLGLAAVVAVGWLAWAQLLQDYLRMEGHSGFSQRQAIVGGVHDRRSAAALLELDRTSLLAPWAELALARTITLDRGNLDDKIALNGLVMRAFAVDDVVYRQAVLLALRGDVPAAQRQWALAVAAYPRYEADVRAGLRAMEVEEVAQVAALLQHVRRPRSVAASSSTEKD